MSLRPQIVQILPASIVIRVLTALPAAQALAPSLVHLFLRARFTIVVVYRFTMASSSELKPLSCSRTHAPHLLAWTLQGLELLQGAGAARRERAQPAVVPCCLELARHTAVALHVAPDARRSGAAPLSSPHKTRRTGGIRSAQRARELCRGQQPRCLPVHLGAPGGTSSGRPQCDRTPSGPCKRLVFCFHPTSGGLRPSGL